MNTLGLEFYRERYVRGALLSTDHRLLIEMLWSEYAERIFLEILTRGLDDGEARDICQETFLQAYRSLLKNRPVDPDRVHFRRWLVTIASRLIAARRRRRGPELLENGASARDDEGTPGPWERFEAPGPDPSDSTEGIERTEIVRRCLEELPERARRIVVMFLVDGLGAREVGERLGLKPGAVRVAAHRARDSLRKCVESHGLEAA